MEHTGVLSYNPGFVACQYEKAGHTHARRTEYFEGEEVPESNSPALLGPNVALATLVSV